jgi:hypothetical protein
MQFPGPVLEVMHRRLAAAVKPGGTLLIVGHHPAEHGDHHQLGHLMFTADDVAALLDPTEWDISVSAPERETKDHEGNVVTLRDAVVRAVRRR